MQITPSDVPQAYATLNMTYTWRVGSTNQLAVVVYTDEEYQERDKIVTFINALVFMYLFVVLASIFLRKFIGLELACLFQMGYLSLLMNKKITLYL